ncbi:TrmH family RNA methyltransferase [Desertibacillus haloalkaliphilus]|uniref:TrmH family RNA methyltransferase n=1 Tax=Desertibacillus haloalkaliphilus TaxID=1328930 RepID=UPI001C272579|nr:RNA methyltransferase [Desertibacillus haloalkaliphilus]MBU8905121.1 RNA methyltransferase [Desertibacillus haloalkaliphilus]
MNRIESHKNQRVKQWKKLHTKKGREQQGSVLIEGTHLIEAALQAEADIEELIVDEQFSIPTGWVVDNVSVTIVTERVMKEISETETPQGIAAICKIEQTGLDILAEGRYLFVDAIQDPGNLGTMIRTADSAGMSGVIVGSGSVDVYNSKVIRATQGSIFHLPVIKKDLSEAIEVCKQQGLPVFGTALEGGSSFTAIEPQQQFALIVGNEGEGVSKSLLEQTDQNLYIPIYGKNESLNVAVATGILLYYLRG